MTREWLEVIGMGGVAVCMGILLYQYIREILKDVQELNQNK